MKQHTHNEADDGDRELEERLRGLPRRIMSLARRAEIVRLLSDTEQAMQEKADALHMSWWRRPVPMWRAIAASIALAGASVAIALGFARSAPPTSRSPTMEHIPHESAAPAAIVFVEHQWPRRDQVLPGHADVRGWRFMPATPGDALQ